MIFIQNKKNFYLVHYLIILFMLISCNEKADINSNSYFGYSALQSSYDSKTGTYMRKYNNDTIKIKIELTVEENNKILRSFSDNQFETFPAEIDCSERGNHPQLYDRLYLNSLTVNYIHNGTGDEGLFCVKGKRFNRINTVIYTIINGKQEIKELDPSDLYYE